MTKDANLEFKVIFQFNPNPFFKQSKIEATVYEEEINDKNEIFEVKADQVNWELDKDPRYIKRQIRTVNNDTKTTEFQRNSFFWMFDEYIEEEMNDNELNRLNPFCKTVLFRDAKIFYNRIRYEFFQNLIPANFGIFPKNKNESN